jgi:hypothetical protein
MKKERKIKTLLIIVRCNLYRLLSSNGLNGGICAVVHDLQIEGLLSKEERYLIIDYMEVNKPDFAIKRELSDEIEDAQGFVVNRHWWTPREFTPRLEWLNEQIKSLKK